MNGLPSVFSLILYLFQFALATFNPGAILLYLSFEKPIYMTLWYSCVCFAYGVSAPYFSYGFHVLPCVSPGGIQFITTNMIIEFFFSIFSFLLSLPCGSYAGLVQRCVIIQKDDNGFGLTVSVDNPVFVQSVKEGKAFLKNSLVTGSKQSKNRKA